MTRRQQQGLASIVFLMLTAAPFHLSASGFALIENSASGQGNAFAGAAATAEDASTIYFNPAGMSKINHRQLTTAGHLIFPSSDFNNNNSTQSALLGGGPLTGKDSDGGQFAIVPNLYYLHPLNSQITVGLGITSPFGLKTEYDDDWVGRYHAVTTDMKTVNINPSISFKANESLSLGFGLNAQYAHVILTSAIDFGALCFAAVNAATCTASGVTPQQADGFADLEGDNANKISLGYNFGLLFEFSDATRVGLAYRSKIKHTVKGEADFTVPASANFLTASTLFTDTDLKATVTLPDSLSLSIYHSYNSTLAVMADATWTGWSEFEELRIKYDNPAQPNSVTTEDWDDSWRFSLGAHYRLNPQWLLRGGVAYDQTPVPSNERRTPRIPGNDRKWVSMGLRYATTDRWSVDVGYSHLFIDNTKINNTFESSVPTLASTLNGSYDASVDILSAQLNWNF